MNAANDQERVGRDRLNVMLELQAALQTHSYGTDPRLITEPVERIQFIKDMHTAIGSELQEMMDEIGWKPWASSNHINEVAAKGEIVDVFHFFMNLMLAFHMTPEELFEGYMEKRARNAVRQAEGYDGIEGKCPRCHRALDDVAHHLGVDRVGMMMFRLPDGTDICTECVTDEDMRIK